MEQTVRLTQKHKNAINDSNKLLCDFLEGKHITSIDKLKWIDWLGKYPIITTDGIIYGIINADGGGCIINGIPLHHSLYPFCHAYCEWDHKANGVININQADGGDAVLEFDPEEYKEFFEETN